VVHDKHPQTCTETKDGIKEKVSDIETESEKPGALIRKDAPKAKAAQK